MMKSSAKYLILISFLFLLNNCKDSSINKKSLNLISCDSPIDLSDISANFYKGINYGKSENNSFDIFLPNAQDKTPLVIFVHGGGFVGGDKSKAYKNEYPEQIRTFLKNNIAFATINYRFLNDFKSNGVITSLSDSKRCLQFIRYYSEELNIDKEKIGMYGSSAGSGTSLWLGLHDDMKEVSSEDPIGRESTRIKAVGALETQATYDITKWGSVVFKPFNFTFDQMVKSGMRKTLLGFYGIRDLSELDSEKMIAYRENIDFLILMSNNDPPIWVENKMYEAGVPQTKKEINHHPLHAKVLKEQTEKIGLESIFYIPKLGIVDSTGLNLVDFMIKNLK